MANSSADPDHRFRLLSGEAPQPIPQAQGAGMPPSEPPKAPPAASEPEREKPKKNIPKKKKELEERIRHLEAENDQLVCALYFLQQEIKELREPK